MANNTIDASPGRPQEQHHQQIAKSSVWLNDAQHKQRARYKYFPHIFPSSFSLPKLLLLLYSFIFLATIERRSILRSTKYRKVFLWELSTCGRSVNGRGRAICASIYVCVCVWATYFCWYFKYYAYTLVYLLVYVFQCERRRGWKTKQPKGETKVFFFESFSKISKKTAGCQLWSA